jgi:hypothetical protein
LRIRPQSEEHPLSPLLHPMRSIHRLTLLAASVFLLSIGAEAQDLGRAGPSYVGAGSWPSGDKPQSKLWFHDGSWWGSLFSTVARDVTIHRLDYATQTWIDTGTLIDDRHTSHADCLSAGDTLYIGSHHYQAEGFDGFPMLVSRYSYVAATQSYVVDPGFPVQISNSSSEALTIARDSTGTLWAAWTSGQRVWIAHTLGDDLSWSTPFVLPVNTTNIGTGDIAGILAFQGRVGVLWSDSPSDFFHFSWHQDGTSPAAWSVPELVQDHADDHLHMKATSDGRVFAILKDDQDQTTVHVRDLAGSWSEHVVSTPADGWTRSILAIDEENRRLMVFGTQPILGGTIYAKVAGLDNPSFAPGRGVAFMRFASDPSLNDPTSTKQSVSSATGLVVLASHQPTRQYWFRGVPLRGGGTVRPVPSFDAEPRNASVPVTVSFTDTSSGEPTAWFWDFGDGTTSIERNPRHVYRVAGNYAVTLEVSNAAGSDSLTKPAFIRATGPRVEPLEDTFVRIQGSQRSWGDQPHLKVGGSPGRTEHEAFLRFDLSGIDPAQIGSTHLRLYAGGDPDAEIEVHVASGGWDEDGLTWDDRPRKLQLVGGPDGRFEEGWLELEFGAALGTGIVDLALVGGEAKAEFSSKEGARPPELVTLPPE